MDGASLEVTLQSHGRRLRTPLCRGFQIQPCAGLEQGYGHTPGRFKEVRLKGRIQQDQIELPRGRPRHPVQGIAALNADLRNLQALGRCPELSRLRPIAFDHAHRVSAPGAGLEAQSARACKRIKHRPSGEVLSQPVEESLPDSVRRRTQARATRDGNSAAAQSPADDAHFAGHRAARQMCCLQGLTEIPREAMSALA